MIEMWFCMSVYDCVSLLCCASICSMHSYEQCYLVNGHLYNILYSCHQILSQPLLLFLLCTCCMASCYGKLIYIMFQ